MSAARRCVPWLLLFACTPSGEPPEPRIQADGPGRHEVMYAVRSPSGAVLVGGLDGAAPAGSTVEVRAADGAALVEASADDDGRFLAEVDAPDFDALMVTVAGGSPVAFTVRDPEAARRAAVHAAVGGAGGVPNDLKIFGSDQAAVLIRSGDDAISEFDLQSGLSIDRGVRLPEVEQGGATVAANPWFVDAIDDRGRTVAVTAFGQGRVYIVDLDSLTVSRTLEARSPVVLDAPFVLSRPLDVDGDGNPETNVRRFSALAPQGVARVGSHLAVAFSGFAAARRGPDQGPVYLPAVVALWSLADLDAPPRYVVLPFLNPQEIRAVGPDTALVTLSGVIDTVGAETLVSTPSGVVEIDVSAAAVRRQWSLGTLGAGSTLSRGGALWISSLVRPEVVQIDLASATSTPTPTRTLTLNDDRVDSVFRLIELPGGLLGAPSFNTDTLHIIDPRSGALDPPPFYGPIRVGPGRPVFDGLQIVARRPGRAGVDFVGPDLYCLAGVASRVIPVELRKILGP